MTGRRRCGGTRDDIPLAPPVMPLHCEATLRFAFPFRNITYTRTGGFCLWANHDFQRMARQNSPVLLPLERLCSARKHPLSSVSGRQRYNTLDFAGKVVCHETAGFIGFFPPGRLCPPLGSSRQGSAAAFGNHCQGVRVASGDLKVPQTL